MKTESNIKPEQVKIETHADGVTEIIFCENIIAKEQQQDEEISIIYTYDEYRMLVPNRKNLLTSVAAEYEKWLKAAKEAEYSTLAAEIRAKRDKLLKESDAEMSLDRIGLDATSVTKFIASLKKIMSGAWTQYRQALRDLPDQPGFPYDVIFPEKPQN